MMYLLLFQVPNLLALKTQEWVKFVAYESVTEVQHKTYSVLLKAGGIAVPDDSILLSLQPGKHPSIFNNLHSWADISNFRRVGVVDCRRGAGGSLLNNDHSHSKMILKVRGSRLARSN